jgi:hypothetical protein
MANHPAQQGKMAHGLPPTPTWARSAATNGWAGQAAQLLNPPGLKVAHLISQPSAVVDLDINGQHPSQRKTRGIKA